MRMRLFVYGTLRRGGAAHELLGNARLIDSVWTEPRYTLLDMGGYPALVEQGTGSVRGEIYEFDAARLQELDRYEDCPGLYLRAERVIAGHHVLVYLLPIERGGGRAVLTSGDFFA